MLTLKIPLYLLDFSDEKMSSQISSQTETETNLFLNLDHRLYINVFIFTVFLTKHSKKDYYYSCKS